MFVVIPKSRVFASGTRNLGRAQARSTRVTYSRISGGVHTAKSPARIAKEMKVTEKDVAYVADLANLDLTAVERAGMLRDLNSILGYIERLNELDTDNVEPMARVTDCYGGDQSKPGSERCADRSREDVVEGLRKSLPQDVALENAADTDGTFFRVPKVIER
jgi:aspartyl-tRNA(Asn)/glutamyl-tRNA(Gln) amidotransferase subunit C